MCWVHLCSFLRISFTFVHFFIFFLIQLTRHTTLPSNMCSVLIWYNAVASRVLRGGGGVALHSQGGLNTPQKNIQMKMNKWMKIYVLIPCVNSLITKKQEIRSRSDLRYCNTLFKIAWCEYDIDSHRSCDNMEWHEWRWCWISVHVWHTIRFTTYEYSTLIWKRAHLYL